MRMHIPTPGGEVNTLPNHFVNIDAAITAASTTKPVLKTSADKDRPRN